LATEGICDHVLFEQSCVSQDLLNYDAANDIP